MVWGNKWNLEPEARPIEKFFSDVSSSLLIVIDKEGEILFANSKALDFVGLDEVSSDPSKYKLGDFLGCASAEASGRCGTSEACMACGLFHTIAEALSSEISKGEYSLKNRKGKASVFRVKARGLAIGGRSVVALSMQDISAEKRKEAMERVFYHDLLNSASGLSGLLELIECGADPASNAGLLAMARTCSGQLIDEINFIRALSSAELDTLVLNVRPLSIHHALDKARAFFSFALESRRIKIECVKPAKDFNILTDESIVVRVLINLIKNALEAEKDGDSVTLGAKEDGEAVIFEIHNNSVMPPTIKSQVFVRSFSTKGRGRGIGTYSVQLFTEQYLKGRVWFTSEEGRGTSFFVRIPLMIV